MTSNGVIDRVIIVTGSGRGIGRGLVRHLGLAGARPVIAELDPGRLGDTVDELKAEGIDCLGVQTDVMSRLSIEEMVDATVAHFGRVDGLVNNARALAAIQGVADITDDQLEINIASIVKGTLWGMQAVYPHMKRAHWGRIVNVGSSAGLIGLKGAGAYGAAKEAVRSLTRTAAREWAVDGIVVNCYCPHSVRHQPGTLGPIEPGSYRFYARQISEALIPTGDPQNAGDPEHDLGPAVAFLCSDGCGYLTGQTLTLDGGISAFA
jgi:NAD(P)-dependent dehydrogenase (short-subunit alcohol dehydrogenase family)